MIQDLEKVDMALLQKSNKFQDLAQEATRSAFDEMVWKDDFYELIDRCNPKGKAKKRFLDCLLLCLVPHNMHFVCIHI